MASVAEEHFLAGEKFKQQSLYREAVASYKAAIELDPRKPAYYYAAARAYQNIARDEKSREYYLLSFENIKKASQLDPANEAYHHAKMDIASKCGMISRLIDEYTVLAMQNPGNAFYKEYLKKLNIVVSLIAMKSRAPDENAGKTDIIKFVLNYVFPFCGCALFVSGIFMKYYLDRESPFYPYHKYFYQVGLILFVMFVGAKVYYLSRLKPSSSGL